MNHRPSSNGCTGPRSRGPEGPLLRRAARLVLIAAAAAALGSAQERTPESTVVVRPVESSRILVNPGMGIQTFQRYNGDAINPGIRWSEVGPEAKIEPAAAKPDFPEASVAYLRWFWSQFEPERGRYRWEILDTALAAAREHRQRIMIRVMPYDQQHPLPEWYRNSGARRANQDSDKDGKIWSPDASDPRYLRDWGALVTAMGARYDGHPYLDSVDVSTVGYWGEGWGPYLPDWSTQKALIDLYFDAFHRTPLLMNFDALEALRYGVARGAGWRLDCWGDLGRPGRNFAHMYDMYPQQVPRASAQDAWQRFPVSLETCGTPGSWKQWGYNEGQLDYIMDQALRWHASTINIKSSAIPAEWKGRFDEFQKKIGYRLVLRKLTYPGAVRRGSMQPVTMWWLNAGVSPVYGDYRLAIQLSGPSGSAVIPTPVEVRKWLPGDAIFEDTVYVPDSLAPGEYRLRIGIIDPRSGEPAIRLAIENAETGGWYDMGAIRVE